jgi:chromosome segregation ATPase
MITWKLLAVAFGSATVALTMIVVWQLVERFQLRRRYAGIRDVEREITRRRHALLVEMSSREHALAAEMAGKRRALETALAEQAAELDQARRELADLRLESKVLQGDQAGAQEGYDKLRAELAELEQSADSFTSGAQVLPPGASDETVQRLADLHEQQKAMMHTDRAITCWTPWPSDGRRNGAQIQKQASKLLLRAFNAECEAAIAQVQFNNLAQMVVRITHAFTTLNKLGAALELELTPPYRALKLEELRVAHACQQGRPDPAELSDHTPIELPREDLAHYSA